MDGTRMGAGEFKALVKRTGEADYRPLNVNYQAGNLEERRYEAMREKGVADSKVMATDERLWHGTGDKNAKQKIPENMFKELYKTLGEPEAVYEEIIKGKPYRIFHFVTDTRDGKKIKIIVHVRTLGNRQTSMRVRTIGYAEYDYTGGKYEKIW
jgi:hypothetical protein